MNDWQERLKDEYTDLRSKDVKLNTFIYIQKNVKKSNEGIGYSSLILLKQQRNAMKRYLDILEKRLIMEGIEV